MIKPIFKPKVVETSSFGPFLIVCGFVPHLQGVMIFDDYEPRYFYHLN